MSEENSFANRVDNSLDRYFPRTEITSGAIKYQTRETGPFFEKCFPFLADADWLMSRTELDTQYRVLDIKPSHTMYHLPTLGTAITHLAGADIDPDFKEPRLVGLGRSQGYFPSSVFGEVTRTLCRFGAAVNGSNFYAHDQQEPENLIDRLTAIVMAGDMSWNNGESLDYNARGSVGRYSQSAHWFGNEYDSELKKMLTEKLQGRGFPSQEGADYYLDVMHYLKAVHRTPLKDALLNAGVYVREVSILNPKPQLVAALRSLSSSSHWSNREQFQKFLDFATA